MNTALDIVMDWFNQTDPEDLKKCSLINMTCCEMCFGCTCAAVGDTVSEDEVVCEIETDKVLVNSLIDDYTSHHSRWSR